MRPIALARFRDPAALRAHLSDIAPDIQLDDELEGRSGPLAQPMDLFGQQVENRFVVQPMEGWDATADGRPSEWTERRWRRFGSSGAGLVWGGEACAVREDGRANPRQLCFTTSADPRADLERLRATLLAGRREIGRDERGFVCGLQLTHSGRWSRPRGDAAPRLVRHESRMDARVGVGPDAPLLADAELEQIAEHYVAAARVAAEAGFDFVDVKACHGYLLHELLAARERPGRYGGSFENRIRLLLEIVAEIRRAEPGLGLGVRLSVAELPPHRPDPVTGIGVPEPGFDAHSPNSTGFGMSVEEGRFDLEEPFALIQALEEQGVRAINVTLGSPYTCPHLQRPAAFPPSDGYLPPRDPLREVECHLQVARGVKQRFPGMTVIGSGYSYLQDFAAHVAQREVRRGHVDGVGFGRMMLSYPQLALDVLEGRPLERGLVCRTFSDCTTAPRHGLRSGCYPLDPHYRETEESALVRGLRKRRGGE